MTIERDQIERTTSKLFQRLLLTSKDIKRTSMQMPHAFQSERATRLFVAACRLERIPEGSLTWFMGLSSIGEGGTQNPRHKFAAKNSSNIN